MKNHIDNMIIEIDIIIETIKNEIIIIEIEEQMIIIEDHKIMNIDKTIEIIIDNIIQEEMIMVKIMIIEIKEENINHIEKIDINHKLKKKNKFHHLQNILLLKKIHLYHYHHI